MKTLRERLLSWLFAITLSFTLIIVLLFWFSSGIKAETYDVITVCAIGCDYTMIGDAVNAATNGDTILIGAGTYTENITLTKVLTLEGDDPATTIVDGNQAGSVFVLTNSAFITLTDLTITNGLATYVGGGVSNNGQLLISNTLITHNTTHSSGSASGGGIYNIGTLTVVQSEVISNTAGFGAGVFNEGIASFDHSLVGENRAWGTYGGGGIANWDNGVLTVTNSSLYGNIGHNGGGLNNVASAYLLNTTVSGNRASYGGGIWNGETVTLHYTTISDNFAWYLGGGISNFMTEIVYFHGTVIGDNEKYGGIRSDCYGDYLYSQDYNLIEEMTGCLITGTVTHNITGLDPQLMPLGNYGYETLIQPLQATSPAIDAASNPFCPTQDQRGISRPQDGNGDNNPVCDMGAYEYEAEPSASITDATILEGNTGMVEAIFTVTLSTVNTETITIDFATVDNTATAGSDYVPLSETLQFDPGETIQTITVLINGDTWYELNEIFSISLTNPIHVFLLDDTGIGTILNDDQAYLYLPFLLKP